MKGFKGFDKDLKCREMQYEIGKTFTYNGPVALCNSGLHFVENPLDVFGYYNPTQRFAEVIAEGVSDQTEGDSKRVARELHIGAEISLTSLLQLGVKFILDKVDFKNSPATNTGTKSAATNTGDGSAATNTGTRSAATNTGDGSAATNTGKYGTAIALGIESKASGALGNFLVIAEWKDIDGAWKRVAMGLAKVDGKKIKADTFYRLKDGKFVEVIP